MQTLADRENYYSELRKAFFGGETDWKDEWRKAASTPRITFQLNRDFNDTAVFFAFDFFVELYQRFGKPIEPVHLEDGCISVAAKFSSTTDFAGDDIRYLILADPRYHDVFRRYGVQAGFIHGFPTENIGYHRFKTNELGIPQPY